MNLTNKIISEIISLPVEIDDTILMGKFLNKRVKVKSIGKDEHGMPTVNGGKSITRIRIPKNDPTEKKEETLTEKILREAFVYKDVVSSNITSIGYDKDTQTLEVQFNGGSVYQYEGVPKDIFLLFKKTKSMGRFFSVFIKGKYNFVQVS